MKLYDVYKDLLITNQLLEALPLSKAKELASIKRNPNIQERLNLIFDKLKNSTKTQVSKRGDRIYIPFNQSSESNFEYDTEIVNYLESNGYKIKDYKTGLCLDKYDRELKIGKVLSKLGNQDLLQKFNTDKGRESKNNTSSFMVFSKHSYDIGGASTDRGWKSCMDLYVGSNRKYILEDVKEGSFIVYLISANDMNIQKPIARILVKPYVNVNDENDVLYSPTQKIYGTAPDNFLTSVNKILENIQKEKVGVFKFVKTLYDDGERRKIEKYKPIGTLDTKEKLEQFCQEIFGTNLKWSVNSNLEIDIDSSIDLYYYKMLTADGKFGVKFGKVAGHFNCSDRGLISLEGGPSVVEYDYICSNNRLRSLEGAPETVHGNFYCDGNRLKTLQYGPARVDISYSCKNNDLKTLQYAPEEVDGDFICSDNPLISLQYAPKYVGGNFDCYNTSLSREEVVAYEKSIGKV